MGKDTAMQVAQEVIEAACYDIDMDALIVNDGAQEKATALIQSALDQERAKALEEVERFIDRGDWCGRDELAEGIRALASNQGKAE